MKDEDKDDKNDDGSPKLGLHSFHPEIPDKTSGKGASPSGVFENDDEIEGRCFGYLRGQRDRALSLELRRLREGDSLALPYAYLGPSRFHASHGVLLVFEGATSYGVRIRGRNLNLQGEGFGLYDRGILRHRVTFVSEMRAAQSSLAGEGECVVERIEVKALQPEDVFAFLGLAG